MSHDILKSRTVLRGAALQTLTIVAAKKDEAGARQTENPEPATLSLTTSPVQASDPPEASDTAQADINGATSTPGGNLSKALTQYQDRPRADKRCANCLHFTAATGTCRVVQRNIHSNGWCMLWVKMQS
ncbi:MAG: high-potential iron-sulfur protein [Sulfuricaulis sp.]